MKKFICRISGFFLILNFFTAFLSAYSAEEILGKENFELLNQNGKIQSNEFKPKEAKFSLLPDTELSNKIAEELASNEGEMPSLIGENIYLIPKENIDLNEASVILRSVSKMEGMQYYSNGEKNWTTLYHDAYCIAGPQDRTRVDDKTEGSANGLVQYCLLNDNSLGKTNYEVSYFQTENEISIHHKKAFLLQHPKFLLQAQQNLLPSKELVYKKAQEQYHLCLCLLQQKVLLFLPKIS